MSPRYILCFMMIIVVISCKKPYDPPAIASPGNYLVVEGIINSGADSTVIKLSRTVNVSSKNAANPVLHASIAVESDQNNSYPLTETTNGNYVSAGLSLDNTHNYCLDIKTSDGKQYLSDFEPVLVTPPIDSVGFIIQANGVQVYVNTHDPNNKIEYYGWDYQETWQFNSKYYSEFITDGTEIVPRGADQDISLCYASDTSSTIVLGSSAKLSQNVIYQNPVTQVPSTSEKLEAEYSILVKQHALTGDAYNFYLNLKKNTEQLGSIFDAQPSNINGNIHSVTNPSEPVIGFISVSTVQQKRVFISNKVLPAWITTYPYNCEINPFYYCQPLSCANFVAFYLIPLGSVTIPVSGIGQPPNYVGYTTSSIPCTDCTIRGMVKPPVFWKQL